MGLETTFGLTLSKVLTAASAAASVASLAGGVMSYKQGQEQAAAIESQAALQGAEQARVAEREARMKQEEISDLQRRQKVAYLASGVTLKGSPLLIMEETRRKGADDINEILQSGKSAKESTLAEGRLRAQQAKASGRQTLVSGITNAASYGSKAYEYGKK